MDGLLEDVSIGFIGLGVMGNSMAKNLLHAGFRLNITTRTKDKALNLIELGANWVDTPEELAANSKIILTMVGYPSDVESLYLGVNGLLANCSTNTYLIDMTTSTPTLAKQIYEKSKVLGIHSLDAPVSGGDIGAREARLSIMVGGDHESFKAILPIFDVLGTNIKYQGGAGAGQHTKMCNQIAIASNMIGVCEALYYANKAGLSPETVLQSISTGAAGSWSLSNLAPRILDNNYEPGFYIKHFVKDMQIALDESERLGIKLPGLTLAKEMYTQLVTLGYGDKGTQALYKFWDN